MLWSPMLEPVVPVDGIVPVPVEAVELLVELVALYYLRDEARRFSRRLLAVLGVVAVAATVTDVVWLKVPVGANVAVMVVYWEHTSDALGWSG